MSSRYGFVHISLQRVRREFADRGVSKREWTSVIMLKLLPPFRNLQSLPVEPSFIHIHHTMISSKMPQQISWRQWTWNARNRWKIPRETRKTGRNIWREITMYIQGNLSTHQNVRDSSLPKTDRRQSLLHTVFSIGEKGLWGVGKVWKFCQRVWSHREMRSSCPEILKIWKERGIGWPLTGLRIWLSTIKRRESYYGTPWMSVLERQRRKKQRHEYYDFVQKYLFWSLTIWFYLDQSGLAVFCGKWNSWIGK